MIDSPTPVLLQLLLLLLLAAAAGTEAKRYDLVAGWAAYNSGDDLATSSSGAKYRILKMNGTEIVSDSGEFALAFLDPSGKGGSFFLSVVHQKLRLNGSSAVTSVWIANRNATLGQGGSNQLLFTRTEGKLILIASDAVWKADGVNFKYMELRDNGEWLLFNNANRTLWRSFAVPSDTLVVGQSVTGNTAPLTSSANSSTFLAGGFAARVVGNSLQFTVVPLTVSTLSRPQPYLSWDFDVDDTCSVAAVALQAGVLVSGCDNRTGFHVGDSSFLRLESNGDLVSYRFDVATWDFVRGGFSLLTSLRGWSPCNLPLTCGAYGYCDSVRPTGEPSCQCINENGRQAAYSKTCPAAPPPRAVLGRGGVDDCANEVLNHRFVQITNAGYFTTTLVKPDAVRSSLSDCHDQCWGSCTCAALFYNRTSGDCYYVNGTLAGSLSHTPGMDAHLKFAKEHLILGLVPPPPPVSPSSSGSSNLRHVIKVMVAAFAGVAVVLFVALMLTIRRNRINRRRQRLKDLSWHEDSSEVELILNSARGLPQRFTYECLTSATQGFTRKLGAGGFGSVYEGELMDDGERRRLAVKKLEGAGGQGLKQFIAEVASMGSISHVNVLKLCGFCIEGSQRLLVYEFMPNGSLDRWLFEQPQPQQKQQHLTWLQRVDVALGVARGLAYLHEECREPIIHLDVKPQNILLDERMVAKVADFGMAKLLVDRDVSHVVTCVRGTPGYLAPEWLLNSIATKKCDVYSYGMVLLELLAGRRNLDVGRMGNSSSAGASSSSEQKQRQLSWYFPAWAVNEVREGRPMQLLDERVRSEASEKVAVRMVRIALWCIQEAANLRPTMFEVVQMLEGHKEVEEPPMAFHFAVQTMVDIVACNESVSMAYVTPPSYDVSSLIR